jgi:hypothetical protein
MSNERDPKQRIMAAFRPKVIAGVIAGAAAGYLVGAQFDIATPSDRGGGIACGFALGAFLGLLAGLVLESRDDYDRP